MPPKPNIQPEKKYLGKKKRKTSIGYWGFWSKNFH